MTNDTRSPSEIEREIENQRADLTSNIESLQDKFSIDTMVRQIGDQFREHGGDMGRSISEQVKANPIPLALTGLGLAWMMFGNSNKPAFTKSAPDDGFSTAEHDFRRAQRAQGRPYVEPNYSASRGYSDPSWAREGDDNSTGIGDRLSDGADAVRAKAAQGSAAVSDAASRGAAAAKDGTQRGAAAVSSAAGRGADAIKDGAQTAASAASDTASAAGAALSDAASHVKGGVMDAAGRIAEGTENLSEEGRRRVIAARQKAVALRRNAARSARDGADAVSDFYDRQPLVVGALAIAVGAALGGTLPRTKTEDDLMGAHSDDLFDQAERIFEEEKSKALAVAQSVKDEVKDIAAETKADLDGGAPGNKSAAEAVGDKAKAVGKRLADKAQTSVDNKNLGKPKK